MNLTLQYFTMYLSFFVSIIVSLFINTETLCCVIPILEAAWMTVMVTVTGGHPSRLSPQCRLGSLGSGKEPHLELQRAHPDHQGGGWDDPRHRRIADQDVGWDVPCDVVGAWQLIMSIRFSICTALGIQRWITRQRQDARGNW